MAKLPYIYRSAAPVTPEQMYWHNEARVTYDEGKTFSFLRFIPNEGFLELAEDLINHQEASIGNTPAEVYKEMAVHDRIMRQEI